MKHYFFQEKKKIYDQHHKKMEQSGESFLDSIRHELEGGPGPWAKSCDKLCDQIDVTSDYHVIQLQYIVRPVVLKQFKFEFIIY